MLEALIGSVSIKKPIPPDTGPPGQMFYQSKGVYTWTVPDGIYSICFVVVGAGEPSETTGSGKCGGGLRYRNNFPVTPGETHQIIVGDNVTVINEGASPLVKEPPRRSSAFGIFASRGYVGSPFSETIKGGVGSELPMTGNNNGGGKSGTFTNGTTDLGRGPSFGLGGAGINPITGLPNGNPPNGHGGGFGGGAGWGNSFLGGAGCVRIIWGANRTFPDKAT